MDTLDINGTAMTERFWTFGATLLMSSMTPPEIEVQIGEVQSQIHAASSRKISGDNIYRLLLAFDEVYHLPVTEEAEQKRSL